MKATAETSESRGRPREAVRTSLSDSLPGGGSEEPGATLPERSQVAHAVRSRVMPGDEGAVGYRPPSDRSDLSPAEAREEPALSAEEE